MACRPPSRTIASGRPRSTGPARGAPAPAGTHIAVAVTLAFTAVVALAVIALVAGCGGPAGVAATSGDKLIHGTTYSVDLDGDGVAEQVIVAGSPATLTITDGKLVYRSRDRWHVVEAALGDTDRDGLLEVVTLLDDHEGRHLGLFAFFGGEYRERLVTSELEPPPLAFEVVRSTQVAGQGEDATADGSSSGDLLRLTVEPASGRTEPRTVLCRWNGFGFTTIEEP